MAAEPGAAWARVLIKAHRAATEHGQQAVHAPPLAQPGCISKTSPALPPGEKSVEATITGTILRALTLDLQLSSPPDMADAANKYSQNVPGAFYVDDQCIDCDLCRETAPANFKRDDDGGHSYVYKQPENDEERKLCEEALSGCPVEAIGSDGE
jgi:ferredoxin